MAASMSGLFDEQSGGASPLSEEEREECRCRGLPYPPGTWSID